MGETETKVVRKFEDTPRTDDAEMGIADTWVEG